MEYVLEQLLHADEACPDPQLLIRHIAQPLDVPERDAARLVEHLFACPKCANLHDKLCDAAEQFYQEKAQAAGRVEQVVPAMSTEMAVADIWQRIDAKQVSEPCAESRRYILRIGGVAAAVAACLLLGAGVFWWSHAASQPKRLANTVSSANPSQQLPDPLPDENPLAGTSFLFVPEPVVLDPEKTDYEKGLHAYMAIVVATRPWIVPVQKAMNAKGARADCLDVLMVSGDWAQFRFDSAQPIGQPLAVCERAAIERLSQFHEIPLDPLTPASRDVATASTSPAAVSQAHRQWRSAILATTHGGSQLDLFLNARQTAPHLAHTYAAAALWVHHHPQEAETLLADRSYRSACEIPWSIHNAQDWGRLLSGRATAAKQAVQAVNELLRMPAWERCAVEASVPWGQLQQSLDKLAQASAKEGAQ